MTQPILPHVVALDDDPAIREVIADYLADNDMRVTTVANGHELTAALARDTVDLVVLDLRLPGEDGMQIARKLREESSIPILMLTGRIDEADRVMGLELGADDYLTKPFSTRELLARIRALLRRAKTSATVADEIAKIRAYRFAGWELNVRLRKLKNPAAEEVSITNGEFRLLVAFLNSAQRILTRDQLLTHSRLHNAEVYDRAIDVQIARLRRKLQHDAAQPSFIKTERGEGYVFTAAVDVVR